MSIVMLKLKTDHKHNTVIQFLLFVDNLKSNHMRNEESFNYSWLYEVSLLFNNINYKLLAMA